MHGMKQENLVTFGL
ncbi:hypothetical protein CK3_04540 [butyrate-producing bacterium SS3/4]|nr:hypothetical protein CK3_04540 [butyrate-producing bacterium SS3/4]